jgi:hypothetical protein
MPPIVIVLEQLACFLLGLGGMAYLIWTGSTNALLVISCLTLTGGTGVASIVAAVYGLLQPPNSPSGITPQSSSSHSES